MKNLLIVGAGFLGTTLYRAFLRLKDWNVQIHDKNPEESKLQKNLNSGDIHLGFEDNNDPRVPNWASMDAASEADLVFVCVPTPMKSNGECCTDIVESVISEIRSINENCWICIKSTVPPGTTQRMHDQYGNVCFNPEFLTEVNAFHDFTTLPYQIIGYAETIPNVYDSIGCPIRNLFESANSEGLIDATSILEFSAKTAEMIKYTRNCYLATRLSFFNEIKQICDKLDIDYEQMSYYAGLDSRVGNHYNRIYENEPEFSGVCLPKDLNALIYFATELGVDPKVAKAVWAKNVEVAKRRTWEKEKGRAVIE